MLDKNIIIIVCLIFALVHTQFDDDGLTSEQQIRNEDTLQAYKIRCSRRFTPGACLESVTRVWTFDFQIQNCTERLGCPSSRRTNRFQTYSACITRCRTLIDLYMQILTYDGKNSSSLFLRQSEGLPGRREGSDYILNTPPSEDDIVEESSGYEAINSHFAYEEVETNDDDYIIQWH